MSKETTIRKKTRDETTVFEQVSPLEALLEKPTKSEPQWKNRVGLILCDRTGGGWWFYPDDGEIEHIDSGILANVIFKTEAEGHGCGGSIYVGKAYGTLLPIGSKITVENGKIKKLGFDPDSGYFQCAPTHKRLTTCRYLILMEDCHSAYVEK